jgi:predicted nucleic acid-binding protein
MTLVVDASVVAEVLLNTERGARAAGALGEHHLLAPDHLAVEVASALRGWSLSGHITDHDAQQACSDFRQLGVDHVAMIDFLPAAGQPPRLTDGGECRGE